MSTEAQRRLAAAKRSERDFAKWLMSCDGPDNRLKPGGGIATSTGRVGHITELQIDVMSATYAGENKHMIVPGSLWTFWKKIVDKAGDWGKQPLLRWEPTNEEKTVNGKKIPTLHVISEQRHAELLSYEQLYKQATAVLEKSAEGAFRPYSKEEQVSRGKGRGKAKR